LAVVEIEGFTVDPDFDSDPDDRTAEKSDLKFPPCLYTQKRPKGRGRMPRRAGSGNSGDAGAGSGVLFALTSAVLKHYIKNFDFRSIGAR
jgi:hypothetical protein